MSIQIGSGLDLIRTVPSEGATTDGTFRHFKQDVANLFIAITPLHKMFKRNNLKTSSLEAYRPQSTSAHSHMSHASDILR